MNATTSACNIIPMTETDELIGKRIAQLRTRAGVSQSGLARLIRVSPQAVQKWEAGQSKPRPAKIKDLASIFHVKVDEFINGTDYEHIFPRSAKMREPDFRYVFGNENKTKKYIIDYSNVEFSNEPGSKYPDLPDLTLAPMPVISWTDISEGKIAVDESDIYSTGEWWPAPANHSIKAFWIRVTGESMYNPGGDKSYAPGDLVAVDPERRPQNRSVVIVKAKDGESASMKQLIIDPDGTQLLKSLNPNWPLPFMPLEDTAKIFGTVIGKWVSE